MAATLARARDNFRYYINCMIAGVDGDSVHPHEFQDLIDDSLARCAKAGKHCVIVAPPEHAKTTRVIRWAIWMRAHNPRLRIGLTSGDQGRAEKSLTAIRKIILSDFNRAIFPAMMPDQSRSQARGEWNKTRLYLDGDTTDPSFEVYPFEGQVQGARIDILIADDVVGSTCKTSEADRLRVHGVIHGTWLNRLTAGGIAVILNNVWHREDPIHKMAESPSFHTLWIGYNGQDSLYWRVNAPVKGWKHGDGGEMELWREVWPEHRLLAKYEADRFYYKQIFGGKAMLAEECVFPPHAEWKRYWPEDILRVETQMLLYAHLDPAGGKYVKKGDYACVCVIGIDINRIMYLLDVLCWRGDALEQAAVLWELHERFRTEGVRGITRATVEVLPKDERWIWPLLETMNAKEQAIGNGLDIGMSSSREPKHARIHTLLREIRQGFLRFPHDWEARMLKSPHVRNLTNQLEDFPLGDHDDGPDALERAVRLAESEGPMVLGKMGEEEKMRAILVQGRELDKSNVIGRRGMDGNWKPRVEDRGLRL